MGEFVADALPEQDVVELETGENPGKHLAVAAVPISEFIPTVHEPTTPSEPEPDEDEDVFRGMQRPLASASNPAFAHAVMIPNLVYICPTVYWKD